MEPEHHIFSIYAANVSGRMEVNMQVPKVRLDTIIGAGFMLFAVVVYLTTLNLPKDVALFPKIMLLIFLITGFLLILQSQKEQPIRFKDNKLNKKFVISLLKIIFALLATYYLINFLGFYASIFLFITFFYLFYTGDWRLKNIIKGGIFNVTSLIALYIVFNYLLQVVTPKGILF